MKDPANRASPTPAWVKALGIIAIALVLFLFIILHLTGAIGPGLHTPPGGPASPTPS